MYEAISLLGASLPPSSRWQGISQVGVYNIGIQPVVFRCHQGGIEDLKMYTITARRNGVDLMTTAPLGSKVLTIGQGGVGWLFLALGMSAECASSIVMGLPKTWIIVQFCLSWWMWQKVVVHVGHGLEGAEGTRWMVRWQEDDVEWKETAVTTDGVWRESTGKATVCVWRADFVS